MKIALTAATIAASMSWSADVSATPSPATPKVAAPPTEQFAWERIGDPAFAPADRGGGFGSVVATDSGFLAAGWDVDDAGVPRPTAWTSPDGAAWTPLALPSPEDGGYIWDVAWQGATGVLVGQTGFGTMGTAPLLYRVGAGGAAEEVVDADFPAGAWFHDVIATPGGGFLAVGALGLQTLVFQSADGVDWVAEAGLAGLISGLTDPAITDVAAGPLGRIAVIEDTRGQIDAGVVYVDTGSGFLPATLPETTDVDLGLALVTDSHFWVYGSVRGEVDYSSAIWRSADGATWERINPQVAIDERHQLLDTYGTQFFGAVATDRGFVGVVRESAVWLFVGSSDGVSWSEIPIQGDVFDGDVPHTLQLAAVGSTVVAASSRAETRQALFRITDVATQVVDAQLPAGADNNDQLAVASVGDHLMIATVAESAPQDLTVEPSRRSQVWTIGPGLAVSAAGPVVDYEIADMIHAGDGSVRAVGFEWAIPRFMDTGMIDPAAWTSAPNGPVNPTTIDTTADEINTRMFAASIAGPDLLVAAGQHSPDFEGPDINVRRPKFWVSTDGGTTWQEAAVDPAARLANFIPIDACQLPSGGALAVGQYAGAVADEPAIYRTADGRNWSITATASSAFGADTTTIYECVTSGDRVVIVGDNGAPSRAAAWSTTDGATFTPLDVFDGGQGSSWWGVHATGDGRLWLLGSAQLQPNDATQEAVLVEVQADGTALEPVPLTGPTFESPSGADDVWYVTSFADRLALVGHYAGGVEVWTAPLPPAPQPVAPAPSTTAPAGPTSVTTASSPTTAPGQPGGVIPPPTQQPTGLGTDPALDALAQRCYDGDLAACDELWRQSPGGSAYNGFADTCAGRQPAGTNIWCEDAFGSAAATTTTATAPPPTTVPPPSQRHRPRRRRLYRRQVQQPMGASRTVRSCFFPSVADRRKNGGVAGRANIANVNE